MRKEAFAFFLIFDNCFLILTKLPFLFPSFGAEKKKLDELRENKVVKHFVFLEETRNNFSLCFMTTAAMFEMSHEKNLLSKLERMGDSSSALLVCAYFPTRESRKVNAATVMTARLLCNDENSRQNGRLIELGLKIRGKLG